MKEQEIAPGLSIVGFDSPEEMFLYMASSEAQLIRATSDIQWQIDNGTYVIRVVQELAIFGYLFTWDEFLADNQPVDDEISYELERLRDAFGRGYRYGRWYSEVVPDGEYGSAHVATMWPITKADFEHARGVGWSLWPELAQRLQQEIHDNQPGKE